MQFHTVHPSSEASLTDPPHSYMSIVKGKYTSRYHHNNKSIQGHTYSCSLMGGIHTTDKSRSLHYNYCNPHYSHTRHSDSKAYVSHTYTSQHTYL